MIKNISQSSGGASIKILSDKNIEKTTQNCIVTIDGKAESKVKASLLILERIETFKNGGPILTSGKQIFDISSVQWRHTLNQKDSFSENRRFQSRSNSHKRKRSSSSESSIHKKKKRKISPSPRREKDRSFSRKDTKKKSSITKQNILEEVKVMIEMIRMILKVKSMRRKQIHENFYNIRPKYERFYKRKFCFKILRHQFIHVIPRRCFFDKKDKINRILGKNPKGRIISLSGSPQVIYEGCKMMVKEVARAIK